MSFQPFTEKYRRVQPYIDWTAMFPRPYAKDDVDPYTKCRIILMTGTEFEAQWFTHNFARHCRDNDVRRALAASRRTEQQQQKKLQALRPATESILETTLSYEQLAVDLTAELAKNEADCNVRAALDFALLEDFDHIFRYANLMRQETGQRAENLLGLCTEIMPARPTISEHRCPLDSIFKPTKFADADLRTRLNTMIITAAEQQTMNYYMNVAGNYPTALGRRLYSEIGMIEEEHVSQYESLIDPTLSWFENLLMHEYTECYLYWSCAMEETCPRIKCIWEEFLEQELEHLQTAARLLETYDRKSWEQVIPDADFPAPLELRSNIDYVRRVLDQQVCLTQLKEELVPVSKLPDTARFGEYQETVNHDASAVPSHQVICRSIGQFGSDYRWQTAPNPIPCLRDRTRDNITLARPCDDR